LGGDPPTAVPAPVLNAGYVAKGFSERCNSNVARAPLPGAGEADKAAAGVRLAEGAMNRCAGKKMVAAAIGIGGTLLLPATALAQTFDVKQLDVTGGALEAASDNTVQGGIRRRDDNRSAHDLSLDYGVSNAWRFRG
jgi:hypothetical protein